jgi:signal transduction histidine kinase
MGIINTWKEDDHHGALSCVFICKDGSRRDVEIKKYPLPDGFTLYGIFDITSSQFTEEASQISMRERRRIGQDLHDSIGQLLTGISLLSRSLANNLQRENLPGDMDAIQISELADDASDQIRQISRGLMPTDIVMRGLFASLKHLAKVTTECCGLVCEVQIDESIAFSDGAVETHLFRIAQEAVNNAVRHANADRIDIILAKKKDGPRLVVRDNGHWRNIMENSGGIGMKTMHYRAAAIDGHLHIGQREAGGTEVICSLELDELLEQDVTNVG